MNTEYDGQTPMTRILIFQNTRIVHSTTRTTQKMIAEDDANGQQAVVEIGAGALNHVGSTGMSLSRRCAELLQQREDCVMSTAAHPIDRLKDYLDPNIVKVVLDAAGRALYFTRAPVPHWRGAPAGALPASPAPLRHLGIYAYRAGFLRAFPRLTPAPLERTEALEQLRVLWHGHRIAVHVTDTAPAAGVDTPEDLDRVRRVLTGAVNPCDD